MRPQQKHGSGHGKIRYLQKPEKPSGKPDSNTKRPKNEKKPDNQVKNRCQKELKRK
jgi:hypothetical protein